jgi:hypothetical protein
MSKHLVDPSSPRQERSDQADTLDTRCRRSTRLIAQEATFTPLGEGP